MKSTRKTYIKTDDGFSLANKVFIRTGKEEATFGEAPSPMEGATVRIKDRGGPTSATPWVMSQPTASNGYVGIVKIDNNNPPSEYTSRHWKSSGRASYEIYQEPAAHNDWYCIVKFFDYYWGEGDINFVFEWGFDDPDVYHWHTVFRFVGNIDHILYVKFRIFEENVGPGGNEGYGPAVGNSATLEAGAAAAGCHYDESPPPEWSPSFPAGFKPEGWHGDLSATIQLYPQLLGTKGSENALADFTLHYGTNTITQFNPEVLKFYGVVNDPTLSTYLLFKVAETTSVSVTKTGTATEIMDAVEAAGGFLDWRQFSVDLNVEYTVTFTPGVFGNTGGDDDSDEETWEEALNVYQKFGNEWELIHCPGCSIVWAVTFSYFDKGSDDFHYEEPNLIDYIMSKSPPWPRGIFEQANFRIIVTIENGVEMLGPLTIDGLSSGSQIVLVNRGTIAGRAGQGGPALMPYGAGTAGPPSYPYLTAWSDIYGKDGSNAISSNNDITIFNHGTMYGGSGGGHGGMPQMYFNIGKARLCHNHWSDWPSQWYGCYNQGGPWISLYPYIARCCGSGLSPGWYIAGRPRPYDYRIPWNRGTYPGMPANMQYMTFVAWEVQHGAAGGGGAGQGSRAGDYGSHLLYPGINLNRNMILNQTSAGPAWNWAATLANLIWNPGSVRGISEWTASDTGTVTFDENCNATSGSLTDRVNVRVRLPNRKWTVAGWMGGSINYICPYDSDEVHSVKLLTYAWKDGQRYSPNQYALWYYTQAYQYGPCAAVRIVAVATAGSMTGPGTGGTLNVRTASHWENYWEYLNTVHLSDSKHPSGGTIRGEYNEPTSNGDIYAWLAGWAKSGGKGGELGEPGESHTVPSMTVNRWGQSIVFPEITIKGGKVGAAVSVLPNKSVTVVVEGTMRGGVNQTLGS